MKGICLRGLPGWGEVIAPLTTVVNTFGGTWFTRTGRRRLDLPGVQEGDQVLRRPGAQARRGRRRPVRVRRVPQQHDPGQDRHVVRRHRRQPAPWRRPKSPVKGKIGYVPGAGREDRELRLALHLGLGHPEGLPEPRQAPGSSSPGPPARSTSSWSARRSAGPTCPAGKRASTYANPEYRKAAGAFARDHREGHRRRRPARTRACSRAPRPASSSSASPSSPTSAPRSRRRSARPSPAGSPSTRP